MIGVIAGGAGLGLLLCELYARVLKVSNVAEASALT